MWKAETFQKICQIQAIFLCVKCLAALPAIPKMEKTVIKFSVMLIYCCKSGTSYKCCASLLQCMICVLCFPLVPTRISAKHIIWQFGWSLGLRSNRIFNERGLCTSKSPNRKIVVQHIFPQTTNNLTSFSRHDGCGVTFCVVWISGAN